MKKYPTQSVVTQRLAAGQTHEDMHPGQGVVAAPTHDAIALRAYDIFVKDGRQPGHCNKNWHQAEQELRANFHRP